MSETRANPYSPPKSLVEDAKPEGSFILASRGQRLTAALLDGLISAVLVWGIVIIVYLLSDNSDPIVTLFASVTGSILNHRLLWALGSALVYITAMFVINGYLLATKGQTIGKAIVKIRIIRTDGSKPSLGRLMALRYVPRYAAGALPLVGGLLALIDDLMIFRQSHQCVHDNIADTVVVKV